MFKEYVDYWTAVKKCQENEEIGKKRNMYRFGVAAGAIHISLTFLSVIYKNTLLFLSLDLLRNVLI